MMRAIPLRRRHVDSPFGPLLLGAVAQGLAVLQLPDAAGHAAGPAVHDADADPAADAVLDQAAVELAEYFAGRRRDFTVPVAAAGTAFRQTVWRALQAIPYGQTRSYAELARMADCPSGFRAVGQANGANPVAIVVPCHRVIAADGGIGGYSGGTDRKRRLLGLEGVSTT